jgi:peptidoglycan/xylan/chitin deacetylase (PgdA/CDA1 family)
MTLTLVVPPTFLAERRWIAKVVFEEIAGIDISVQRGLGPDSVLSRPGSAGRVVFLDGLFHGEERSLVSARSLPSPPLAGWAVADDLPEARTCEASLPVLYGTPDARGRWLERVSDTAYRVRADLLGGAFFMLSRLEEAVLPDRDAHGRLPADAGIALTAGFLDRPLVDEYAAAILALVRRLWPRVRIRSRGYRLLLSHDVDLPFCRESVGRRVVGDLVRRRDPSLAARRVASRLRPCANSEEADVCFTFERMMDRAERSGVRSAFYFFAGGEGRDWNGSYAIDDPRIRQLIARISSRGHEVGIHPSYDTFDDPAGTRAEVEALRRACESLGVVQEAWGGRQHYLRWRNPITWQNWADAGLDYDSTVGFAGAPGFRAGTCHPYTVFNLVSRRPLPLVERPLIVMEGTLLDHMRLGPGDALATIEHLAGRCRRVGGDFTLLWHNNRVMTRPEARLFDDALRVAE